MNRYRTDESPSVPVSAVWIVHRRNIHFASVYQPELVIRTGNQAQVVLSLNKVRTSVIIIPANGPKKIVYPFMKLRNPWALFHDSQSVDPIDTASSLGQDLPRTQGPASNKSANYLPTSDVDILCVLLNQ